VVHTQIFLDAITRLLESKSINLIKFRETPVIGMAVNWAINEENEKEILRVSIVNEYGHLLFDSVIQPSLTICYAPLYYGYLYDPSFGIPIRYLSDMVRSSLIHSLT
jgi:hypothetical protein